MRGRLLLVAWLALPLAAQETCQPTPAYSPCELIFDLNEAEAAAHPDPYLTVQLQAEFRSPRHRTFLMPAFWDGGRRLVIRFTPTEAGAWDFRITTNLARFEGKSGQVHATESPDAGFLLPANLHHWAVDTGHTTEGKQPHLWMGDSFLDLGTADAARVAAYAEARSKQKFNHVRALLLPAGAAEKLAFPSGRPAAAWFREFESRIAALNARNLFVDLILAASGDELVKLFPTWQDRERFVRYAVGRLSSFHITWQGVGAFEESENARALLKEIGLAIKKYDPYDHPRSTGAAVTSSPLAGDGWMDHITTRSSDNALGAIEHQLYPAPFVSSGFAVDGKDNETTFRHRLWNASMNGQYPAYNAAPGVALETPVTKLMTAWFEFFGNTRHWELEPYFDVDGGRALALPGVEYILYIEKPSGPVEVLTERHSYDVYWVNPSTGERIKQKKDYKGEKFTGEAPDNKRDWVLHLSRDGRKEGMLRSYKFESMPNLMQEVDQAAAKAPFEILEPAADTLSLAKPPKFFAKLKRETRATRSMLYLWTAEVVVDNQGGRVVGTGPEGVFRFPPFLALKFPAVLNVRLTALNANGKAYSIDRVYRLTQ